MIYSALQFEGWIKQLFPTIKEAMDTDFIWPVYGEDDILNEDFFQYMLSGLSWFQLNTLLNVPGLFYKNRTQQYVSAINFYSKLFYDTPSFHISLLVYKRARDLDKPSMLVLNSITTTDHYESLNYNNREELYLCFEHRPQLDDTYHKDTGYSLTLREDSSLVFKQKYEQFISMLNKQLEDRTGILVHSFDPDNFQSYRDLLDMTKI